MDKKISNFYNYLNRYLNAMSIKTSLLRYRYGLKAYIGKEKIIVAAILAIVLYYCWPTVEHNAFIFYVFPLLTSITSLLLSVIGARRIEDFIDYTDKRDTKTIKKYDDNNEATIDIVAYMEIIDRSEYIQNVSIVSAFNIFIVGLFYVIEPYMHSIIQGLYLIYMLICSYELKSLVFNLSLLHQYSTFFFFIDRDKYIKQTLEREEKKKL